MAIEIVDFPIKHGAFPIKNGDFPWQNVAVHQAGYVPVARSREAVAIRRGTVFICSGNTMNSWPVQKKVKQRFKMMGKWFPIYYGWFPW